MKNYPRFAESVLHSRAVQPKPVGALNRLDRSEMCDLRRALLGSSAAFVGIFAGVSPASAETASATQVPVAKASASATQAPAASSSGSSGEIFVTGTRIKSNGYSSPTPLTVLSGEDIAKLKPSNVSDLVRTLPAVTNANSAANSNGSTGSGRLGVNSVSLRGLGAARTLVLINGHRTVASTTDNQVDVSTIPQDLVERVDVITGGASAQYGSDAVAGVVNFILNEKFSGLKLSADGGVTNYGDGINYRFGATAGQSFLNGRGHILVSGEYFRGNEIKGYDRPWNSHGYVFINNPNYVAGNGQPQFYVGSGIGPTGYTPGGLITSGPLRGTYFQGPGVTNRLNFGQLVPGGAFMIGGDWQTTFSGVAGTGSLGLGERRGSVFVAPSFEVSDALTLYGQFSWNHDQVTGYYERVPVTATIRNDNAYLLSLYPNVAAAMAANGLASINIGTSDDSWPRQGGTITRDLYRYVAGAKGKFRLIDQDWSYDAYYQHGVLDQHSLVRTSFNTGRLALATDAVLSNGQIICRSTLTDPTNGCVPVNRLGVPNPLSPAAIAYIYGPAQPSQDLTLKQDVASLTLNGTLFNLPAGPVAIALGGEWRKEAVSGTAINPTGVIAFRPVIGSYTVKEGFVEVAAPLFKGFNVDGAARYTDYSTSGGVATWKVGATYNPIPDLKFRGTYSHDIRAPNLQELFGAGIFSCGFFVNLPATPSQAGGSTSYCRFVSGNPNLKPESSNTWTAGAVITPSFMPGFALSADYFDIRMKNNIATVGDQQAVNYCYGSAPQFCNNIIFSGGQLQTIIQQPTNLAREKVSGIDAEASYRLDLARVAPGLGGTFAAHAQASYYFHNYIDNLVQNIDYAGTTALVGAGSTLYAALPHFRYRVTTTYDKGPYSLLLAAHGFDSTVYGNGWITCTAGCPAATPAQPTINNNHIPGAVYFDASAGVKFHVASGNAELRFIVNNLFNTNPVNTGYIGPTGGFEGYPQTTVNIFNTIGREFRLSATVKY